MQVADNDPRNELSAEETKNASKNKNKSSLDTNASSALLNLMGMVPGNKSQDNISQDTEIFNNNHCEDQAFRVLRDKDESLAHLKSSRSTDNSIENSSSLSPKRGTRHIENKDQKKDDILSWTQIPKENSLEINQNKEYQKSSMKRQYENIERSNEPNTTESKFFRFSALAKELSGR